MPSKTTVMLPLQNQSTFVLLLTLTLHMLTLDQMHLPERAWARENRLF